MIDTQNQQLHALLEQRFSPRSFSPATLSEDEALLLLEAARRAPSASNVQPWRFAYALRGNPRFDALADTLTGNNRVWAPKAAMLLAVCAFELNPNGNPNHYAFHDCGQAIAHLTLQAESMGLHVHQMGGFEHDKLTATLQLPGNTVPVAVSAIGYLGHPNDLPENLRGIEVHRQPRKSMDELLLN